MPKILALIPARGGSKGIHKKNIVMFGGYPLISYSIAAAKLSRHIDRIIVTTDDKEIADTAKKFHAEVPFLRPKELSKDSSTDIGFFVHALDFLEKNEGYVPDFIVQLRPTTPLRDRRILDKAISVIMGDKLATSLRSAHVFEHPGYKLFRLKGNYCNFFGKEDFNDIEYYDLPRQRLPATYFPNGYVDVIIPKIFKETGLLHGKRIRAFITEKTMDIDCHEDLKRAEGMLNKYSELKNMLDAL